MRDGFGHRAVVPVQRDEQRVLGAGRDVPGHDDGELRASGRGIFLVPPRRSLGEVAEERGAAEGREPFVLLEPRALVAAARGERGIQCVDGAVGLTQLCEKLRPHQVHEALLQREVLFATVEERECAGEVTGLTTRLSVGEQLAEAGYLLILLKWYNYCDRGMRP